MAVDGRREGGHVSLAGVDEVAQELSLCSGQQGEGLEQLVVVDGPSRLGTQLHQLPRRSHRLQCDATGIDCSIDICLWIKPCLATVVHDSTQQN